MKQPKVICFVPARFGSTRVKNKNIRLINGRPLIYWTVIKALKSKKFDKIYFSSNSKKYYKILIRYLEKDKYSCENIFFDKRSADHSNTKSKIFDYLKFEFIKKFDFQKNDLIVQMLPTCPLRSIFTIKKAINFSMKNGKNCFTACEYDFHISFGFSINKRNWKPIFRSSPMLTGNTQSQSQKNYYHPNGAVNCLYVRSLNQNSRSIYHKAMPIIISKLESFDLDTEDDFKLLKKILNKN